MGCIMQPPERERIRAVFQTILEAAHVASVGITVSVEEGDGARFVYVNARAAELNNLTPEDMIGQPVTFQVAPEDLVAIAKMREERLQGAVSPRRIEVTLLRKDGSRLPLEVGLSYASYQGRTAAVTFLHDISDRRRVLEALQESEARFRRLIEAAPEAIGVARDGAMAYANPALVELFGLSSASELVGRSVAEMIHPEDRQREAMARCGKDARAGQPIEYRIVRPDGQLRTIEAVSIGIEFEGAPAVLGFARDVTERNRIRSQLVEADRLAAVGTLAAGVGHEINNPLAYVLLNLQALERELPRLAAPERVADALEMVRNALTGIDRVRTIARDLKSFARSDPDARGPVDVRRVLESAINMAAHEIRLRARLVTHFEELPPVLANEARLGQVFLNLLLNAAQALPERRTDRSEVRVSATAGADDRVIVEVSDTGPGVPESMRERIFAPYFTTKPLGVGTGLGLSIGRSIVASLGGTITVNDAPGGGATFRVELPVLQSYAAKPSTPPPAPRDQHPRLRVLIVEDEPALALALERALGEGHDALVVPGGREALGVLTRDPSFDVVLCDVMMPGMSGVELYQALRAQVPGLADRFVFMTGGTQTPRIRAFLSEVGRPWLEKPFDARELRQLLVEIASPRDAWAS
jgi:PAS domain S-box-containing protein